MSSFENFPQSVYLIIETAAFFAQVGNQRISVFFLLGNYIFPMFPELVSTSV